MFAVSPFLTRRATDTIHQYDDLLSEFFGNTHRHDPYSAPYAQLNLIRPRLETSLRPNAQSDLKSDSKFQVLVNVKQFRPDEIEVKIVDDFVVVHSKHEEIVDEHGFVSREFTRRYKLPDDVEPENITSSLSIDDILTIQAPRKVTEPPPTNERIVPIIIQQHAAVEEIQKLHEQQQQQEETEEKK